MKNKHLISIITPIFNGEKFIAETIESVINQTYEEWEMIIVDNCSTDGSAKIVKNYQEKNTKIKYIKLDYNSGGPARPRNIGLKNAKGDYVAFLDADDVWLSKKLELQINFLIKSDFNLVHSLANVIDGDSRYLRKFNNQKLYSRLKFIMKTKNILFYTNYININSVLMENKLETMFDENDNYTTIEDWKFWIDNSLNGKKIGLINKTLLNYRIHNDSISLRGSDIAYRKSILMLSEYLLAQNILLKHYFFSNLLNFTKILLKKYS